MAQLAAGPRELLTRGYDRAFDWAYAGPEPPQPIAPPGLLPIHWDGLPLNTGDQPGGLCLVVENIEGWLDSPPLDGHDAQRSIADGAAWGPKTLGPREITLTGIAAGPRDQLIRLRNQLGSRAAAREPAELAVYDRGSGRVLVCDVRAGSERLRVTTVGLGAFRYQVVLTAADPVLYDAQWHIEVLVNFNEDSATGRDYAKDYSWSYASPTVPNTALLAQAGNTPAPVFALYRGDLSQSRLTNTGAIIHLSPVPDAVEILVATASLTAEAIGGLSRSSFILPGSTPMWVPPAGRGDLWHLYATGAGTVTLAWRSAWI
jgi:hypothetical protein